MEGVRPKSFADLVGYRPAAMPLGGDARGIDTHGTTVLALRYREGVLTLADRRATMGNLVMYDHADKILALDDHTVVAISGSFARSIEVCRMLKHAFKYYARTQLHELSLEGKLNEVSRALQGNLSAAMSGVGLFLPILSAYDRANDRFEVFFFDGAGARFQNAAYACAGSGSERIRGVFEYIARSGPPWSERSRDDVLFDGLRMLDIAADLDSATGGFGKVLPTAHVLDRDGNRPLDEAILRAATARILSPQPA